MDSRNNGISLKAKALAISIGIHLVYLGWLATVHFSNIPGRQDSASPLAMIRQIKNVSTSEPVAPKPKVNPATVNTIYTLSSSVPVETGISSDFKKIIQRNTGAGGAITANKNAVPITANRKVLQVGTEFFGSFTAERKVCYVVDCSGSMQGIFSFVQKRLVSSIEKLQPDQYFSIIFFGGDRLTEYGGGGLVRAGNKAKAEAIKFVNAAKPYGRTNALSAIRKAISKINNDGGVIYFLTDGFELSDERDCRIFSDEVESRRREFSQQTQINTIGFWVQKSDQNVLEKIARQSGGEFVLVEGPEGQTRPSDELLLSMRKAHNIGD